MISLTERRAAQLENDEIEIWVFKLHNQSSGLLQVVWVTELSIATLVYELSLKTRRRNGGYQTKMTHFTFTKLGTCAKLLTYVNLGQLLWHYSIFYRLDPTSLLQRHLLALRTRARDIFQEMEKLSGLTTVDGIPIGLRKLTQR